jgi:hypothetical protein
MKQYRLIFYAVVLSVACCIHAQTTVTVFETGLSSSSVSNSAGALTNGTITWCPVITNGVAASYTMPSGGTGTAECVTVPIVNGAFSISIPDTDHTNPQYLCFSVTATVPYTSRRLFGPGYTCVQPHYTAHSSDDWCQAGQCDFGKYIPNLAALMPVERGLAGETGQGFTFRGAWVTGTAYHPFDVVTNGGQTYEASTSFTSAATFSADASNWNLWAQKGDTGQQGIQGIQGDAGQQGIQGIQGDAGIAGSNGQGFTFRGAWVTGTAYHPFDVVTNGGQTYEASTSFTSAASFSADASNWNLWAQKGDTGATGTTGATGSQGPQGIQGNQGNAGPAGSNGSNGNTILSGTSAPTSGTGNNGDFYLLNPATAPCLYGPKASGSWPGTCTSLLMINGGLVSGNVTVSAPAISYICTAACTITPLSPTVFNSILCVQNGPGVSSVITIAGITGVYYGKTDNSGWASSSGGTITSAGAPTDAICIQPYDSTHYIVVAAVNMTTN